jgi:hypothetical protein
MPDSPTAVLRRVSEERGPEVASILLAAAEGLPAGAAREVQKAAKDVAFSRSSSVELILDASARLAAYDRISDAVRLAEVLTAVPFTGDNTLYEPIRGCVHIATRFATTSGDSSAVSIQPFVSVPDGWTPNPTRLEGRALTLPLDNPGQWAGMGPKYVASALLADVAELSTMWVFGGSASWSRDRIDAQIETSRSALGSLKGYAPLS